jgi:ABC-type sugar transport system ATPase subunit
VSGVRLEGVVKEYGDAVALRGVDLDVADGELLVVLGPSGCGKTTLLRIVAGLEHVSAGTVAIGGHNVTHVTPARRNVSMVFQSYALFPHMTVAENIGFGLVVRKTPKAETRQRVERAAELAGCRHLLDRRPAQLSGGERQRAALARALVREPDVFLLDEPLSNLDAELRAQTRAELKALHQQVGGTMLYVTHDQFEALTLGDRVAVLRDGSLQQVGTPDELWREPANAFVARFVGFPGMNLLPSGTSLGLTTPDGATVGVRPESLRLAPTGAEAQVVLVEPAGGDALVHLVAGGEKLVARVASDGRPAVGETVRVSARPEDLAFFDAATGLRWDR